MRTAEDLFGHELALAYDAELKAARAIPRAIAQATDPELVQTLKEHRGAAEGRVTRLEQVFGAARLAPGRLPCAGINGVVEELLDAAGAKPAPPVRDLITAESMRRIQRYQVCVYQGLITRAVGLRLDEAVGLLSAGLAELGTAGDRYRDLAIRLTERLLQGEAESSTS